jgi:hypothetical protein
MYTYIIRSIHWQFWSDYIGAINNTGSTPSYFWTGLIDQVSYVSRAKTATEILSDATLVAYYSFDNGSFYDLGPNKINGVN